MPNIRYIRKEAMILAAGKGSRMRYRTKYLAKPLIKIFNKSLLEINLKKLYSAGIENCTINTNYKKNTIHKFVKKFKYENKYPNINLIYEKRRLDTGGGVKNAIKQNLFLNKNILVVNGDSILINKKNNCPVDLLFDNFDESIDVLLLLAPIKNCIGYSGKGDFIRNEKKGVSLISRKKRIYKDAFVFTGWQIINSKVFDNNNSVNFSLNNIYDYVSSKNRLYGIIHKGWFLHVGDPKSYFMVKQFIKKNKIEVT